jgi:hypothetical protein
MPFVNNNQRQGTSSNSHVGAQFEAIAFEYFQEKEIILLQRNYELNIGVELKKKHKFDFGNDDNLIECKSHTWTNGKNAPSAKMSVWNEAMYYFNLAPKKYRKILFVLMDFCQKRCKTLVQYYIENYYQFIPKDVIFYEYFPEDRHCEIYEFEKWKNIV